MKCYTFTDEELEYISDTLRIVAADLHEIRKISPLEKLHFVCDYDNKSGYFEFNMNANSISFGDRVYSYILEMETTKKKGLKGTKEAALYNEVKNYDLPYQNIALIFLSLYDKIRKELIDKIKSSTADKAAMLVTLKDLRAKYSTEVYVDFGELETQNAQKLEVIEEDGKKIGTINFGNKIVKIVTEGDIILEKIERAKQKIK